MKQKELLADKVAFVTGDSRGIGFGTAKRLKEEGAPYKCQYCCQ